MFRDVTLWKGQERPGVIFPAKSLPLFLVLQQQREARASARNVTQCDITKRPHLVEEPAAAGITGAAVGDVGEPDGFFWSSSEDSKDVWPPCLSGKPNDSLLEVALVLRILSRLIVNVLCAIALIDDRSYIIF